MIINNIINIINNNYYIELNITICPRRHTLLVVT